MLATSVAVHDPSATRRSSTGEGADDRSLSVSSAKACPEGVIPKNKSSVTNLTVAFTFGADIAKRITHACIERVMIRDDSNSTSHKQEQIKYPPRETFDE